jgi:hypothetical protein
MYNFNFYNVNITKSDNSNQIVVRGDIENRTGRNYSAAAVRIVLFVKNIPIANVVTVVNGLPNNSTKSFEKTIEELDYTQVGKEINRYDILIENAY